MPTCSEKPPALGSEELIAETGEVYALALLRDVPFENIASGDETSGPGSNITPREVMDALAGPSWSVGAVPVPTLRARDRSAPGPPDQA